MHSFSHLLLTTYYFLLTIPMFHLLERYTVESVTAGHPDKVCDQISDSILDAIIEQDPFTRSGVETFGSHGTLMIGGEVKTKAKVNFEKIARKVYRDIGYTDKLEVFVRVAKQSGDIAMGVDTGGAGDQGIMYGYATDETEEMLPLGVVLSHALARRWATAPSGTRRCRSLHQPRTRRPGTRRGRTG